MNSRPAAVSYAYYNTQSCGDGGFSAGLLHGASRAWSEALHTSGPSRLHVSKNDALKNDSLAHRDKASFFWLLIAALAVRHGFSIFFQPQARATPHQSFRS